MRFCSMIFLCSAVLFSGDLTAQRRRPPAAPSSTKSTAPTHFLGAVTNYNHLSGFEWESSMSTKRQKGSKSSFSIIVGQSSRFGSFELNEETGKKSAFVNGLGAGVMLNNYIDDIREGIYWSLGVSGHYYFHDFVDIGVNDLDEITVVRYKNLKTFSVFGGAGYKWKTDSKQHFKGHLILGLMGSPFRSSSPADINGLFYGAGLGYSFRLN